MVTEKHIFKYDESKTTLRILEHIACLLYINQPKAYTFRVVDRYWGESLHLCSFGDF